MSFVQVNDLCIHYELAGNPGLPVLVLSHSLGASLDMWKPQLSALAGFRVLRYDTRGHGQTSVPIGPYSAADLGGDVLGLLDELGIEQASFCGLSMGGIIGQWLGIHAPHRLHRLILTSTAAKIGSEETWNARIAAISRDGVSSIIPVTLERWFTADFRASAPETIADIATVLEATPATGYAACCAAIRDADFRASVSSILVPTLVISGSEDPVTPPQDGHFLARSIAGAQYVELPAAHLCSVELADDFNRALVGFLAS